MQIKRNNDQDDIQQTQQAFCGIIFKVKNTQ